MYLIDTKVLSELRKVRSGRADSGVSAWVDAVDATGVFVSAISFFEIELGILLKARHDKAQGKTLWRWFDEYVKPAFHGRVIGVDHQIASAAAAMHVPDPQPLADSLIAATALVHGLKVVTGNTKDFAKLGVDMVDPWARKK